MSDLAALDAYGALIEPATLKIQRLLPGVWRHARPARGGLRACLAK